MSIVLNYAANSDRGLVRSNNEDSAFAGQHLLALADGMGGHAAGEVASQLMIATISTLNHDVSGNELLPNLAESMAAGNQEIQSAVEENPLLLGMGCTLTTLLFDDNRVAIGHVGDSRAYLLRDGKLSQITKDDTYVQSLVDEGKLDAEEVSNHPQRSLILKAYTGEPVEPTLSLREVHPGDRYMLCSDGLSDPVSNDTIEKVLAEDSSPQETAEKLVDYALRGGGPDNVTVIVADALDSEKYNSADLPDTPILVGAINSLAPERPRPNTSAGRAASLSQDPSEEDVQDKPTKRVNKMRVGAIVLVALLILVGLGAFFANKINNTYYIASDNNQIKVYHGMPGSALGISLQRPYQEICLDRAGDVKLLEPDSTSDCHRFSVQDLTPSARGLLEDLPTSDYQGVQNQLSELTNNTLPVCVVREKEATPVNSEDNPRSTSSAESSNNSMADLTTPGVSCRELPTKSQAK